MRQTVLAIFLLCVLALHAQQNVQIPYLEQQPRMSRLALARPAFPTAAA